MPSPENPESDEELEQRLRKLLGEEEEVSELDQRADEIIERAGDPASSHLGELSEIEDEFKDRIGGMDERLAAARKKRQDSTGSGSSPSQPGGGGAGTGGKFKDDSNGLAVGLSLAYALIGVPLVGAGIGLLIDRAAGTSLAGIFTVGGVVLAMAYVLLTLSRQK